MSNHELIKIHKTKKNFTYIATKIRPFTTKIRKVSNTSIKEI